MDQIIIQTLHGLVNGMVLAMVASGLTLIFGIMDIVNFAHGDLLMLGAFVGASVLGVTGSYWLALIVAMVVIAILGALLQITTLRPLIGRDPLTTILATFGVSLVIQKYALWQWGPSVRQISAPVRGDFNLFHLQYPWYRIAGGAGRADHRRAVALPEVRQVRHLDSRDDPGSCDGAGDGYPGAAGLHRGVRDRLGDGGGQRRVFGPVRRCDPDDGIRLHPARVHRGGRRRDGNLGGSILASIFVSLLESYAAIIVSPAQAVIVSFVVLVLTMLFRPTGLFVPTPK
jgi:branched-subunit amino acid ABC-type transport system permease component